IISAVGSLSPTLPPGHLVLINDHINFQFTNPLVGPNIPEWGPRFPSMEEAYDPVARRELTAIAVKLGIPLSEGVYLGVLGPSFETPAEIRAFRMWGADVVGMSTVPEVIVARHCGLKVITIGVVTNMAAGMGAEKIDHALGLKMADTAITHLLA